MKHFPVVVAGKKAAACVESGWEWATVSLKFSHRRGQKITFTHRESDMVSNVWVDEYPTYTAIRFQTEQKYWEDATKAIQHCVSMVQHVTKSVNMDADDSFVTKELLIILG